jgi:hypothetical protein
MKNNFLILKTYLSCVLLLAFLFALQTDELPAQTKQKSKTRAAKTASLCAAEEEIVWSCATENNKIASVCASRDLTIDKGYVQYRFGTKQKIELEAPRSRDGSRKFFGFSRYTRPLVTLLMLRFELGDYTYEIHDDYNGEETPAERSVTIDLFDKSGETLSSVECRQPVTGSLMKLEDIVPRYEYPDI